MMAKGLGWLGPIGLGAGIMYLLDPEKGPRRRALLRDKAARSLNQMDRALTVTARDVSNRTQGLIATVEKKLHPVGEVSDTVLVEQIRSKLGRIVTNPKAIDVTANQGWVTLRGPVLAREVDELIGTVSSLPGVQTVDNQMQAYENAQDDPGLQDAEKARKASADGRQNQWSPASRLMMGALGGVLTLYGARRKGPFAKGASTLGMSLLARGVTNLELDRLVGLGGSRRAVDVQKSILINAPVEDVFSFWMNYENFPRFMSHIREVKDLGNERSHWVAVGPMGAPVEWDAEIIRIIPHKEIAWQSVPGSAVKNEGTVRFKSNADGSTRIDIQISYNPPGGAIGHAVAQLLGSDLKTSLDEDLVRMKSLIEEGKTTSSKGSFLAADIPNNPTEPAL